MPALSQERLGIMNSVFTYGDGHLWSIANLTNNPNAAVVATSCVPLIASLKHFNEVSTTVMCCTVVCGLH